MAAKKAVRSARNRKKVLTVVTVEEKKVLTVVTVEEKMVIKLVPDAKAGRIQTIEAKYIWLQ